MRETPLSICERNFITSAIRQNQRLDGRKNDEFRTVKINYGADWGSVLVALGETKVLGQVSCELGIPKATRPNEGMLFINVELGPMAAPHFEASRNSDLLVQINRTLERTFKDSRCVDLESLCVMAEERAWVLRVDLNVLNHEGNLIDCCSIAALCALAHFRRPDVSIIENDVHIHTAAEKEPIPIVLHHYPLCVSYCTFDEGRLAVADPTAMEERTAESSMIFGLNSFRELCCLNLGGSSLTSSVMLIQNANRAAKHAQQVVDRVKRSLETDFAAREAGQCVGFTECLRLNKITSLTEDRLTLRLRHFSISGQTKEENDESDVEMDETNDSNDDAEEGHKKLITKSNIQATSKQKSDIKNWLPDGVDDDENDMQLLDNETVSEDDEPNLELDLEESLRQRSTVVAKKSVNKKGKVRLLAKKNLSKNVNSDSEEEDKVVL